jgi:uncharacterized repeat protein (TIGR01451 family)
MTTSTRRRRFARAAALAGTATIIASVGIGWHALSASAAFPGAPYETDFEIDGNLAVEGGQDWQSDPAAATNLRGAPFTTLEVCDNNPVPDPNNPGEEITDDVNRIVQGNEINGILIDSPPVNSGNVNRKSDLCSVHRAYELVFVPTADAGDDPNAGQYNFVLYGGWSRPNVQGEINVLFPLLGPIAGDNSDDLIVSYDFEDNTGVTFVEVLAWDGDSWEPVTLPAGSIVADTKDNIPGVLTDNSVRFGEFALNLTTSGILPENGPCVTYSTGDPITRTGNASSANLMDIVDATPLTITNCGSLTINKHTRPATPATPQTFGASTSELDGAIIQSPDTTELSDSLVVPDSPSVTHAGLLISPDYVVSETDIPAGWTQESLVCTSFDPIVGVDVTRTLYDNGDNGPDTSFPIAPGVEAVCDITNVGPPTVSVTKTVVGPTGSWSFDFTIDPLPAGETEATKTADNNNPVVSWQLEAGVEYTIQEEQVDGYIRGDVSCGEGGETFTPEAGDEIECTVTNTELIPLDVTTQATASLERTIGWSLEKSVTPASQEGEAGADAGTSTWTVVATKTVTLGNFGVDGTVTITNHNAFVVPFSLETTLDDGTEVEFDCNVFTVPANGSANCTFTASPTGSTATKATSLVTPTDGILDPVSKDAAVSFTVDTLGDETVTVDDDRDTDEQFPADISESTTFNYDETFTCSSNPDDYTGFSDSDTFVNTATLSGEGTDLSDSAEVTVDCDLPPASVDVTKTVEGETAVWSFDFTISPVPAGETATKAATNSAPTVGWDGLVPGTEYTITETGGSNYIQGTLVCAGGENGTGTSTFTPAIGQAVSCTITNDEVEQQAPPIADIAVVKTASPTVVTPGGNVTWTLLATNNGPDAADNVTIVDNLPSTLTLVSFTSPAGWDCSATVTGNPGKLSCAKPTMGLNESATFTLTTTVAASAAGTSINNTAVVSTTTGETTTSNNQDSEPITVQVAVLPPTGASHVWDRLAIAASLVLAGGLLLAIDRRRRITS